MSDIFHVLMPLPIEINRNMVLIANDFIAGYLLNCIYTTSKEQKQDPWVRMTPDELAIRTMLTQAQISRATNLLVVSDLVLCRKLMSHDCEKLIEIWYLPDIAKIEAKALDLLNNAQ